MKTHEVYRLETKCGGNKIGNGVYINRCITLLQNHWYLDMLDEHQNPLSHPNIYVDEIIPLGQSPSSKMYCGFPSLELLKEWFGKYLDNLLSIDYVIVKYVVSEHPLIGNSRKQLMFNSEKIISKEIISEKINGEKIVFTEKITIFELLNKILWQSLEHLKLGLSIKMIMKK